MKVLFILLTILKILGLIIAGIIGLILLILAVVLFVPIRYRGKASFHGKPDVSAKITYLLHILTVTFDLHDGKNEFAIKIFGHKLGKKKKKEKRKKRKKRSKKQKNKANNTVEVVEDTFENDFEELPVATEKKVKNDYVTDEDDDFFEESFGEEKKSVFKNLKDKYNNISAKVKNVSKEINDESNKRALRIVLGALGKVFRHIKPKEFELSVLFGTGEPAMTGEILGALYAATFLIGLDITVTPDFENKVFELDTSFKGRIRIFTLARIALKLYKDKDFKNALHRFI